MFLDAAITTVIRTMNRPAMALLDSRVGRRMTGRSMTRLTYTGRKSGTMFSLPVVYRRTGDTVTVLVLWPSAKAWWRNFEGEGAPISVLLDGEQRPGHGRARRYGRDLVRVSIKLLPVPSDP